MATRRVPVEEPEEEAYDEEEEQLEQELPPGEPQTFGEKLISKCPWWAISVGLHTVAALIVAWFWVINARPDEEAVVVSPPRKPRIVPEMEKPRDLDPNKKRTFPQHLPITGPGKVRFFAQLLGQGQQKVGETPGVDVV